MSKKNRRKTIKKEGVIRRNNFSVDDSKIYIIATIIMFHILPLFFVIMGENGQLLLSQFFLVQLNPLFIALTGLIYGIKKGFNFKFPLVMGVIAAASVPMYYNIDSSLILQTSIIEAIVYIAFAFISTAIGGFVKKLLNL